MKLRLIAISRQLTPTSRVIQVDGGSNGGWVSRESTSPVEHITATAVIRHRAAPAPTSDLGRRS
ncbi:hypothetical protein GCM10029976_068990 [Kribbella albertanoniae]